MLEVLRVASACRSLRLGIFAHCPKFLTAETPQRCQKFRESLRQTHKTLHAKLSPEAFVGALWAKFCNVARKSIKFNVPALQSLRQAHKTLYAKLSRKKRQRPSSPNNDIKGVIMAKKCKKCGVPLEGLLYNLIASKIFGVKPSEKDSEICNKCVDGPKKTACCCGR